MIDPQLLNTNIEAIIVSNTSDSTRDELKNIQILRSGKYQLRQHGVALTILPVLYLHQIPMLHFGMPQFSGN